MNKKPLLWVYSLKTMKQRSIFLFSLLFGAYVSAFAQINYVRCDTWGYIGLFTDFALGDTIFPKYVRLDTAAGNLWQVGATTKAHFTPKRGLMTDTTAVYPINNRSAFEFSLIHCPQGTPGYIRALLYLSLEVDTDSLKDGLTIESRAQGDSVWHPLGTEFGPYVFGGEYLPDTLAALGELGFSGQNSQNVVIGIGAWWGDTTHVRVVFASDSVADNRSGVKINEMMVNFFFESVEPVLAANVFSIQPNPASEQLQIAFADAGQPWESGQFSVTNMQGQTVLQGIPALLETSISVANLPSGIYLLRYAGNGITASTKFTKN